MILGFPWWHYLVGAFVAGVGWHLAASVFVTLKGIVNRG